MLTVVYQYTSQEAICALSQKPAVRQGMRLERERWMSGSYGSCGK